MIYKQLPTFVTRTYRGGALLKPFLRMGNAYDSFTPEDWITSFNEAKNRVYIPGEGISLVETSEGVYPINTVVKEFEFGAGRTEPGVLIKFLDAGERLGIQVHPTRSFAKRVFNSEYGKTESWFVIATRPDACIYIGFTESITKDKWRLLYEKQDIAGMLALMHRFEVKKGDVVLVTGGTPHAIGAGCLLMEVQEPSDYTMRVEKVTVAGEELTPLQLHYGAGEEELFNCFEYEPLTYEQAKDKYFIQHFTSSDEQPLVTYDDTYLFSYTLYNRSRHILDFNDYVTVIAIEDRGLLSDDNSTFVLKRGDRFFISANANAVLDGACVVVCHGPAIT